MGKIVVEKNQQLNAPDYCRLCGSHNVTTIVEGMELLVPTPYPLAGDMRLLLCADCSFLGATSSATADDYTAYYIRYNKHQIREGALETLDRQYFDKILSMIISEAPGSLTDADLLDFGSGAKLFSRMAIERGAQSALNHDLHAPISRCDFDIVVSTHCFEHILDFNAELDSIVHALKPDGLLCIAVPDARGYLSCYYGPYNAFDLEHINHFDCNSLCTALTARQLTPVAVKESERRVTPTLAYPEVIVIARKTAPSTDSKFSYVSQRLPLPEVVSSYLDRSRKDLSTAIDFVEKSIQMYRSEGIPVSIGFYGLSSYAFRVIRQWKNSSRDINWLSDSDTRLTGKTISETPIFDFPLFAKYVEMNKNSGTRTLAFVAAVNATRIVTYLRSQEMPTLDIMELPPNCQNRGS